MKYENTELKIIKFKNIDIIATSSGDEDDDDAMPDIQTADK